MSHTASIDNHILLKIEIDSSQYFIRLVVINDDQSTSETNYQLHIIYILHYFIFESEWLYVFIHISFLLLQINRTDRFEFTMTILNECNIRKSSHSYDSSILVLSVSNRNVRIWIIQMSRCADSINMTE